MDVQPENPMPPLPTVCGGIKTRQWAAFKYCSSWWVPNITVVTDTGCRFLRSAAVKTCRLTHHIFGDKSFTAESAGEKQPTVLHQLRTIQTCLFQTQLTRVHR